MTSNYEPISSESLPQQELPSQSKVSTWDTFKHHIPRIIITCIIDVFVPLVVFFLLENHVKPVFALLAASSPPLFMIAYKAIWERSFDSMGFVVSTCLITTAIFALAFNSPYILLLEKSLLTGIGAVVFTITLMPLQCCPKQFQWRPLAYYFYFDLIPVNRTEFGLPDSVFDNNEYTELTSENNKGKISRMKEATQVYAWVYDHSSSFRISCYFMTSAWAVAFCLDFIIRFILICSDLSIDQIYYWGQITFCILAVLCLILQICTMIIERKHTLAFIEQWKIENLTPSLSTPSR
ncbi:unnamed protein product [Adineta steineri]|uniref:Uncharacterized protein n=1 Tax=Adineta steineri TaxID=433720 RepID=A0A815AUF7_9BILA|nr:unnamed protein product [Adineta steineri]CAF1104414.1 unnamed protein product [Adineta steineri]CAF1261425.1 unnamed protein product [Adineta steineri]CAF1550022.1 unnamed protein product [Adineta steineri]